MLRILIIWIGTYSAYHVDIHSSSILSSKVFPIFNAFYLLFLFKNFYEFLKALNASGAKRENPDGVEVAYAVLNVLYTKISDEYSGEFNFLGKASGYVENFVVLVEVILVFVTFYLELQLIAHLAN